MEYVKSITSHPWFLPTLYYAITLFGAVAMCVFSLKKGFEGAIPFLKKIFPERPQVFYDRTDFLLVSISGSVIGTIFFAPASTVEALAAGFGWVGAVNVLLKENV